MGHYSNVDAAINPMVCHVCWQQVLPSSLIHLVNTGAEWEHIYEDEEYPPHPPAVISVADIA